MAKTYQFKRSKGLFQADKLAGISTADIAKKSELLTAGKIKEELLPPSSGGSGFIEYPDVDAKNRFYLEMNKKAQRIGMNNTVFLEPAGYPSTLGHYSTAKDLVKMTLIATTYKELMIIDKQPTYVCKVKGDNARNITLTNINSPVTDYHIFFSKVGSVIDIGPTNIRGAHFVAIGNAPDGRQYVGAVLHCDNKASRAIDMKSAFDNASGLLSDPSFVTTELNAVGACVSFVPLGAIETYAHNYDLPVLFGKDINYQYHMASTTKVMTAMLGLDYIKNLDTKITVKTSDIQPPTGALFYNGDIVTLRDALYNMMLPSSNTMSHAVARTVGNMILNYES